MRFKLFVKTATSVVEVILTFIILIMFTAFALKTTELTLLTNSLILIMVLVQLYTINVIIDMGDKLETVKRK
jgi:hypothetical protein